jgi:hypothetical protein
MIFALQVETSVTGIGDVNKVGQTRSDNDTCVVVGIEE